MITKYEVTNKEYYDKKLSSPIYPGNGSKTDKSGVTIAIGYDLGHINKEQFRQDFKDILPENQIKLLEQAIGLKGPTAKKFI